MKSGGDSKPLRNPFPYIVTNGGVADHSGRSTYATASDALTDTKAMTSGAISDIRAEASDYL